MLLWSGAAQALLLGCMVPTGHGLHRASTAFGMWSLLGCMTECTLAMSSSLERVKHAYASHTNVREPLYSWLLIPTWCCNWGHAPPSLRHGSFASLACLTNETLLHNTQNQFIPSTQGTLRQEVCTMACADRQQGDNPQHCATLHAHVCRLEHKDTCRGRQR